MALRTVACALLGLAAAQTAHASPQLGADALAPTPEDRLPPLELPVTPRAIPPPAVELQLTVSNTLGLSITQIQGQELSGRAAFLNLGLSAKLPRTWLGLGVGADVGFGAVEGGAAGNDEPGAWAMEANAYLILRRLRLGVGWGRDAVDSGSKDGAPIDGVAVSGRRAFATFDLFNCSGLDAYVGVSATAPRSDYARTTLLFGVRVELPKGLSLPADPCRNPETRGRDAIPSSSAG